MFSDIAALARNSALAWHAKNVPARTAYRRWGPQLSFRQAELVGQLSRDGIATAHVSELFPAKMFDGLSDVVRQRREDPLVERDLTADAQSFLARPGKRKFLVDLWGGPHVLDFGNPFVRLSVSDPILNVVNAYLGLFARLREFFLEITAPVSSGREAVASQRWHADPDDRRMVKVFLYLNDVDEAAGPFTYILHSHEGGKWRDALPHTPKKDRHPDPELVRRMIPPEEIMTATGRQGTLIFCDTAGVHRGGYATRRERVMYTSVYTTPGSALPTRFVYPNGFDPRVLSSRAARWAAGRP